MHLELPERSTIWLNRFAWLTCVATLLLICSGGMVTSKGVGLAVPDWPTTFGYNMFLFPVSVGRRNSLRAHSSFNGIARRFSHHYPRGLALASRRSTMGAQLGRDRACRRDLAGNSRRIARHDAER